MSAVARELLAPPLRFAIACLGSVCSRGDAEEGRSIYQAGASLWPVMVEVDNGLARSIEMLLAVGNSFRFLEVICSRSYRLFCSYHMVY